MNNNLLMGYIVILPLTIALCYSIAVLWKNEGSVACFVIVV